MIKGVSKKAVKISDNEFTQELWPSFTGMLRDNTFDTYTVKQSSKTLNRIYTKGDLNHDGSVTPFVLDVSDSDPELPF